MGSNVLHTRNSTQWSNVRIFEKTRRPRHCIKQSKKARNENKKGLSILGLGRTKDKGNDFYDVGHEKEIKTRAQMRLVLWAIQLKNARAALAKVVGSLEQGEIEPSVTIES